jgi:glyoxylase-like metal-dependent hydrolase (beta-lactamase superfamily II)
MTITRRAVLAGGLSLAVLPLRAQLAGAQQAAAPVRELTPLAGPVYRFRNNFHYSVVVVTHEGVIATDPINADAARWLKAEIAKSFSQPVRFLVYSHDHADHISGGEVFADTARIVAHENARRTIIAEKRPTAVPQVTFTDRMVIEFGGTAVELSHVGRNHSDNSIVMRFPAERILFAVDFIPVKSVGFRDWPDAYIEDWIESLRRVESMDFDVLVPGHGPIGTKDDVRAFRVYMEELRDAVTRLAREGKSEQEVVQAVQLAQYESWGGYKDMFALNVAGMYRHVQSHRRPN